MSLEFHTMSFFCETRSNISLQLLTIVSLFMFLVFYVLVYEEYCIGKDAQVFFEEPHPLILILLFQFVFYIIVLCIDRCKPCRSVFFLASEIIIGIYIIFDLALIMHLGELHDDCEGNEVSLCIDSFWNAVLGCIVAVHLCHLFETTVDEQFDDESDTSDQPDTDTLLP